MPIASNLPAGKTVLSTIVAVSALTGCAEKPSEQAPPPPIVETATVRLENVPNIVELPGRIQAVRTAEVRARTNGIIEERLFEEGTDVLAGTPLFRLDARDYRAQVAQARATLQRNLAAKDNAAAVVRRYRPLVKERAISAQEYDAALSDMRQAEASVADSQAALERAQLTLSYTVVRAPIAGRVGAAEVTEGALVSGTEATLLTRVNQMSPIYAVFTESSAAILDATTRARRQGSGIDSIRNIRVKLTLENGQVFGPEGRLDFAAAQVDPQTGTQQLRARFANPGVVLKPGQFVRGRIIAGTRPGGIIVPAGSVQIKDDQASVMLLGNDGKVLARPVTLGQMLGNRWIVASGLKAGERLIVDGWAKTRPGQPATDRAAAKASPAPSPANGR